MRRPCFLNAVAMACSLFFGAGVEAAVCASTFGAGSSFGGGVYAAQGLAAGSRIEWAFTFTPSVDCLLGTSDVAFHLIGGANALRISVADDASGLPSSSVIESTTVIGEMTTNPVGSIVSGFFSGATLLSGGTTYWIVVEAEPVSGDTNAVWHASSTVLGPRAVRFGGVSWLAQTGGVHAAFRVTEPAPVPALPLWGLGVLAAAILAISLHFLQPRPFQRRG